MAMTAQAIAILSPGDMGHAVGRVLKERGLDVVTCLAGRSARTRALAVKAGLRDVADLATLVKESGLILSILPPASALDNAKHVAAAMKETRRTPAYADCNAVSPSTVRAIGAVIADAGAPFIDGGIIGRSPAHEVTRFYVSRPDTSAMTALDGKGLAVRDVGPAIGRASGLKMCYAALTKGTWTLHTAVLLAAESLGLGRELKDELLFSQKDAYARMEAMVPRLPADSQRWIGEMEEIAKTFTDAGVTPAFHEGAADIFRLLAATPFAKETREALDGSRTLDEAVRVYAETLKRKR